MHIPVNGVKDHAFGRHYIVELIGCRPEKMRYIADVRDLFLEAAKLSRATVLESYFHQFEPHGVTGMIFIAESHFSIHTWPESGYAALDILTCGDMDPEKAIEHVTKGLQATQVVAQAFTRGFNDGH